MQSLLHGLLGVSYPAGRTALYLIPLGTLAVWSVVSRASWKPARVAALAAAAALAACYAAELHTRSFLEWADQAGSKPAVKALLREAGNCPVRIAASPALEPMLSFYRERYRLRQWPPIQPSPEAEGFDYYVLDAASAGRIVERHLREIYGDRAILVAGR
jgi:hypothetical protein